MVSNVLMISFVNLTMSQAGNSATTPTVFCSTPSINVTDVNIEDIVADMKPTASNALYRGMPYS